MACALLLVAVAVLASADSLATLGSGGGPIAVGPERQIFDVSSQEAWRVVHTRLKELGLQTDKLDTDNQVLLTRWRGVTDKDMRWLPTLTLEKPWFARRIRFQVFVSPFAQPARVYVGSLIEAGTLHGLKATVYNKQAANRGLLAEFATAISAADLPRYTRDGPDPCWDPQTVLERFHSEDPVRREAHSMTEPRLIPLTKFTPIYPSPDLARGRGGVVTMQLTVLDDGSVTALRVVSPPTGVQLEQAALGAASLLLFTPLRLGECSQSFIMTYTVRFQR